MVDIEFDQEDYEVIYKWPNLARKEIFQKNKRLKAEKSKKVKKPVKPVTAPKPVEKITPPPPVIYSRIPSYYSEDVEECFTHRDSNNQKVDDFIDLVSSDDEPKGIFLLNFLVNWSKF